MVCVAAVLLIVAVEAGRVEPVAAAPGTAIVREADGGVRVWVLHPRAPMVCALRRGVPA